MEDLRASLKRNPNVFDLLDHEWSRLRVNWTVAHHLADVIRMAHDARLLADIETLVRSAPVAEADEILLALAARSVECDALAARVLLQLLMPSMRSLAERWWVLGELEDRASAVVAAVYDRIQDYPVARRPGGVAANILLAANQDLGRSAPRIVVTPQADPTLACCCHASAVSEQGSADELLEILGASLADGDVKVEDARLIARSRICGDRIEDIAGERGLAASTLWNRRRRAEWILVARGPVD